MANLIIKPASNGSLILQDEGGTAANTIDASGNTQLAGTLGVTGNATLSGTANNLGTATAGTLNGVVGMLRATTSSAGRNVWNSTLTSEVELNTTSNTDTGLALTVGAISGATDFLIFFSEDRKEQSWNETVGRHLYSIDNGSNWVTLGETFGFWDNSYHSGTSGNSYQRQQGIYYLSVANGSTLKFKLQGYKMGSSNAYRLNYNGAGGDKTSITALKITQ